MAQCEVKLRPHPTKKSTAGKQIKLLTSDFGKMIGLDISDTVVQTMACELRDQESIGNKPTHLLINNGRGSQKVRTELRLATPRRQRGDPGALVFKAQAFFGRPQEMRQAAADAFRMLRELTRIRSGLAKQNYHIFVGTVTSDTVGKYVGQSSAGIMALRSVELTDQSTVSIVGPLTTYGRKLYWNPVGGKTVVKRFPGTRYASRNLGISIRGGFKGTETIHTDVKKRMRRKAKWKALSISDPFYVISPRRIKGTYPETMKRPLRMPAITIQVKKAGKLS